MRITGGKARGIPLKAPAGDKTRPAMDAIREAVFSHLGPRVEGAAVLDLCAGTGAYGLEALSRGAASCVFVEKSPAALTALEANVTAVIKSIGEGLPAVVQSANAFSWLPDGDHLFDLIFIDPPYALLEQRGDSLRARGPVLLAKSENARMMLECPGEYEPGDVPGLRLIKRLGKGKHQPSVLVYERE